MGIRTLFKKQGGFSLLRSYAYNHILLYAFFMFLLIPKNKKGLELFRELLNLKIYRKIKRKYRKFILQQKDNIILSIKDSQEIQNILPKVIWFCWLQGIEKAPPLVISCYESVKKYCTDYEIRIITENNFSNFADIPDFIVNKWKKGIITHAHFSDILRTALLVRNGGIWIDSTVLLTAPIPNNIEKASFFLFRTYKPGSNGKAINLSSWFISSQKSNRLLVLVQKLLCEYWKKQNFLCDYFLFHIFLEIAMEVLPDEAANIPKYTNETPHFLLFELGNDYNLEKWESITKQSFCHKLTNKLEKSVKLQKGTFYDKILEN